MNYNGKKIKVAVRGSGVNNKRFFNLAIHIQDGVVLNISCNGIFVDTFVGDWNVALFNYMDIV